MIGEDSLFLWGAKGDQIQQLYFASRMISLYT